MPGVRPPLEAEFDVFMYRSRWLDDAAVHHRVPTDSECMQDKREVAHQEISCMMNQSFFHCAQTIFSPELRICRDILNHHGPALLILDGPTCHHNEALFANTAARMLDCSFWCLIPQANATYRCPYVCSIKNDIVTKKRRDYMATSIGNNIIVFAPRNELISSRRWFFRRSSIYLQSPTCNKPISEFDLPFLMSLGEGHNHLHVRRHSQGKILLMQGRNRASLYLRRHSHSHSHSHLRQINLRFCMHLIVSKSAHRQADLHLQLARHSDRFRINSRSLIEQILLRQ
jgi:hypothetical protein